MVNHSLIAAKVFPTGSVAHNTLLAEGDVSTVSGNSENIAIRPTPSSYVWNDGNAFSIPGASNPASVLRVYLCSSGWTSTIGVPWVGADGWRFKTNVKSAKYQICANSSAGNPDVKADTYVLSMDAVGWQL